MAVMDPAGGVVTYSGLSRRRPAAAGEPGKALPAARSPQLTGAEIDLVRGVARPAWPRVSVVVPALNEAHNLPHVLNRIPEDVFEVILVDGGSVDGTVDVARRLLPRIRVLRQTRRGKGNALMCGFGGCRGDVVVMVDADGSADPAEIPSYVAALLDGAHFAKGTRFHLGGSSDDITRLRGWGNWWLNRLVNLHYGTDYTDLCYGYNAFWTACLPLLDLSDEVDEVAVGEHVAQRIGPPPTTRWGDGFEIETLINLRTAMLGMRVSEVGSVESRRIHGRSNLNAFRDGMRVLRTIAAEQRSFVKRLPQNVVLPEPWRDAPVAEEAEEAQMTAADLGRGRAVVVARSTATNADLRAERMHDAPVRLVEVELSRPVDGAPAGRSSTGVRYGAAQFLVRLHGHPLGTVVMDLDRDVPAAKLRALIRAELADRLATHLAGDGLPLPEALPESGISSGCRQGFGVPAGPPLVSVVVATCERAELLPRCLDGLLANDYPNVEILVVDNNPEDGRVRALLTATYPRERVCYLAEPRRGASRARNIGLAAARGELVAFADDDTVADPGWIRTLVGEFAADPAAVCVTGLVRPLELETPAQIAFERHAGFGRGFRRRVLSVADDPLPTLLFPYTAGICGSGNNLAARRDLLQRLGGFDTRLGPGTPTRGGEDLDLLVRLLLSGGRVIYSPAAVVHHRHRRSDDDLRHQLFTYGTGATACLTKWFLRHPQLRRQAMRQASRVLGELAARTDPREEAPAIAAGSSRGTSPFLLGYLAGPWLWWRSGRLATGSGRGAFGAGA